MVKIDRQQARKAFRAYVEPYDATNPRIALKIKHTMCVARIGECIAQAEGLGPDDVDLAWLCCLLHDIGRFEQLRLWDTFLDGASASHPAIGVGVLFGSYGEGGLTENAPRLAHPAPVAHPDEPACAGSGRIESFIASREEDALIRDAVAYHSDFRLPAALDARTRTFCDIVRDADKVDIFRASAWESSPATVLGVSEDGFFASRISDAASAAFLQNRTLSREERHTPADHFLGTLALAYELVYPASSAIADEQGFLAAAMRAPFGIDRRFDDAGTQRNYEQLCEHLRDTVM